MSNQHARPQQRTRRRNHEPRLTTLDVASDILEALNSATSLKLFLCLKYKEYLQVARAGIDPADYTDDKLPHLNFPGVASFMVDTQALALLSKFEGLSTGLDTEWEAKKKFVESELHCRNTNDSIRSGRFVESPRVNSVLHRAQRKIAAILGDVPKYSDLDFKFGPGGNYGIRGDTSQYRKLISGLECTNAMTEILPEFLDEFPGWFDVNQTTATVTVVPGSRLTFVPKNAKTDRPICIEPCLNTVYQKGFGSYIRNRLRRWGIDLRDQSINQRLACRALSDGLATVDFSSASDTISYALVYDLLPIDWAVALDIGRSPSYEIDGRLYDFQKFSSMGNAYTFELETLIFFAVAISSCEEIDCDWVCSPLTGASLPAGVNLSVYGDDVILPSRAFTLFSECAVACGFSINNEKTFASGLFYESCGKDYFNGTDVRPFYIKKDPASRGVLGVYYVANQLKRWTERFVDASGDSFTNVSIPGLLNVYWDVVSHVAPSKRLYGPEGYGDGHLVTEAEFFYLPLSRDELSRGWCGRRFESLVSFPAVILPDFTRNVGLDGSSAETLEWPMQYALYTSAYGSGFDGERVDFHLDPSVYLHSNLKVPQHSAGYHVRDRVKVKKAAIYVM